MSEWQTVEVIETPPKPTAPSPPQPTIGLNPFGEVPGAAYLDPAIQTAKEGMSHLRGWDPATFGGHNFNLIDYMSDIPDPVFRNQFAAADNNQEREHILNTRVGPNNWVKDENDNYAVTPTGMKLLGLPPAESGKASIVDAPYPTMADVYDLLPAVPGAVGATGGAMMGAPLGPLGAIGGGILGGMLGETAQAGYESMSGQNLQPLGQVGVEIGTSGLAAGVGEGIASGITAPIGRKLLAPYGNQVTPNMANDLRTARSFGLSPSFQQVIPKAPIGSNIAGVTKRLMGDNKAVINSEMLRRQVNRFLDEAGPPGELGDVGKTVSDQLKVSRVNFGKKASRMYQQAEKQFGGLPIVPTARMKATADEIVKDLELTPGKGPLMVSKEVQDLVRSISSAPDYIPLTQAQALRGKFWDAADEATLVPGLSSHQARNLWRSANKAFDDIGETVPVIERPSSIIGPDGKPVITRTPIPISQGQLKKGKELLGQANDFYKNGIRRYDDALVNRITKDPSLAGAVEPEMVIEQLFRTNRHTRLANTMELLPADTQAQVRRQAMDRLMSESTAKGTNPDVDLFMGGNLMAGLNKYSRPTIEAMFGAPTTSNLYRFARAAQTVSKRHGDKGGLIAAGIAAHPIHNLPILMRFRMLSRLFQSDVGTDWLIEGIKAPNARELAMGLNRFITQVNSLEDPNDENSFNASVAAIWSNQ